jgi:hypothetical protein
MLERLIGFADDAAECEHLARMCSADDPRLRVYCATAAGALCAAYTDLLETRATLDHLADRVDQWTADTAPLRADPRALEAGFAHGLERRTDDLLDAGANPLWVRAAVERCILFRKAILVRVGKGAPFPIDLVRARVTAAAQAACGGGLTVEDAAALTWPLLGVIVASANAVGVAPRTTLLSLAFAGAAGAVLVETATAS